MCLCVPFFFFFFFWKSGHRKRTTTTGGCTKENRTKRPGGQRWHSLETASKLGAYCGRRSANARGRRLLLQRTNWSTNDQLTNEPSPLKGRWKCFFANVHGACFVIQCTNWSGIDRITPRRAQAEALGSSDGRWPVKQTTFLRQSRKNGVAPIKTALIRFNYVERRVGRLSRIHFFLLLGIRKTDVDQLVKPAWNNS